MKHCFRSTGGIAALISTVIFLSACGQDSLTLGGGDVAENSASGDVTCTVGIFCDDIFEHKEDFKGSWDDVGDGIILDYVTVEMPENETVMAATLKALEENDIEYSARSNYIAAIGGISEFDCGRTSGWTYTVNDVWASVNAASFHVSEGDKITWNYSCTYKQGQNEQPQ